MSSVTQSFSKNYYISSRGKDSHTGLSPARPWRSFAPLNKVKLLPGDSILVENGSIIQGGITFRQSGTKERPIVVSSYGVGKRPVLTGARRIRNWKKISDKVYEASIGTQVFDVFYQNQRLTPARFPNRGYLTIDKGIGKDTIFCAQLNQPDSYWQNATLKIRTIDWVYETRSIAFYRKGMLIQGPQNRYPLDKSFIERTKNGSRPIYDFKKGYGFFLEGLHSEVDSTGEWSWNQGKLRIYIPNGVDPTTFEVEGVIHSHGISIQPHLQNIRILGLDFQYFEKSGISVGYHAQNMTIANNTFNWIHGTAIDLDSATKHTQILSNTIKNILGRGIAVLEPEYAVIDGNLVKNIGLERGYGWTGVNGATGILIYNTERKELLDTTLAHHNVVRMNRVDSCGYNGVRVDGHHNLVEYNVIDHCSLTLNDGANLYCFAKGPGITHHSIFRRNIIRYSIGDSEMTPQNPNLAFGIYLDNNSHDMIVEGNTVMSTNAAGLVNNDASFRNVFRDNTVYDCKIGIDFAEWANSGKIFDCQVLQNTFVSTTSDQRGPRLANFIGDFFNVGHFDYNVYVNLHATQFFYFETKQFPTHSKLNLPFWQWKRLIEGDAHSLAITSATMWAKNSEVVLQVNDSNKTKWLDTYDSVYWDVQGNQIKSPIELPAFSSFVMFKKK